MPRPWLSVIMPTYNGAAYVAEALESIARQDDHDLEVLAVDDGSEDDTLAILQSFVPRFPLRIMRRPGVGNWTANTNHALGSAEGEWVCFLHQDDRWCARRLAHLRRLLRRFSSSICLALSPSWYINSAGRRVGLIRCPLPGKQGLVDGDLVVERLLVQNFIVVPAPIFKRDSALKVGGLDENLWYTADWDFWLKLARLGPTTYLPVPLTELRVHPASQTLRRSRLIDDFRAQLETVFTRHYGVWRAAHPEDDSVERAARFSLELNTMLAASVHGRTLDFLDLARGFLGLGALGRHRFLRDSRIVERVAARIRGGLAGIQRPGAK